MSLVDNEHRALAVFIHVELLQLIPSDGNMFHGALGPR